VPPEESAASRLCRTAEETFGWAELRPEQLAAMEHIMAGRDVLVVLPTGAGKSAIYQVPAVLLEGPTVVVSPLIALQRDQVAGLRETQAPHAVAVNSTQRAAESERAWDAITEGLAEYVFLSPEQLAKDEVVAALARARPSLFVVDEAHCVSAWGHDFRPDYLRLRHVIDRLGHPRVVALTATAAPPVRADIAQRLGLREHAEVADSFDRPNLHLAVARFQDEAAKRRAVVERVISEDARPGLVYVATRGDTEEYAGELAARGVRAVAYHGGMRAADRRRAQRMFMDDEADVVVATSAFGMGIDKPDVRFVFHASVPASIDAYYQEIGRAGRDGEPASAALFYRPEDLGLQKFLTAARPRPEDLVRVVRAIRRRRGPVPSAVLRRSLDLPAARCTRAVNLLEQAEALTTTADGRLCWAGGPGPAAAVRHAVELAEGHQQLIRSRLDMMRGYAETTGCRRQYLLGYFGEQLHRWCEHCDVCENSDHAVVPGPAEAGDFPPNSRVRHAEWGDGVVMRVEDDRMTVLFEAGGYKTLHRTVVRDNDLLSAVRE
jgi:ATP-dependent DNA helicase RecQ